MLAGLLVGPPPGTAAAVLVNAQVSDWRDLLPEDRVRLLPERPVRRRPRHAVVPGRLRRGDPPLRDLVSAVLQQAPGDPAPRRDLRRPLGDVPCGQSPFPHARRRFSRKRSTSRLPYRTSHGQVTTRSCTLGYGPALRAPRRTGDSRPDHQAPAWAGASSLSSIVTNRDHRARASFPGLPQQSHHNPPASSPVQRHGISKGNYVR